MLFRSGVSNRVKEKWPNIKIIAVDAEGSVIFGGPPKKRHIPGLGSSIQPPLIHHAIIDELIMVSERDTIAGCEALLKQHGIFAGGSSGTVYSAISSYAAKIADNENPPSALFLCPDRGAAYLDTIYNPEWVAERYG